MAVIILLELLIGLLLTINRVKFIEREQRVIWLSSFLIFTVYTIISDSYIKDPLSQYFISQDQITFYRYANELSILNWREVVIQCFSANDYSGSPGAFLLFATIVKIGKSIGIIDILLLLKSSVNFIASFIPIIIYKIIRIFIPSSNNLFKQIMLFVIFSPLFVLSSQLLRDIHISFLFLLLAYIAIKPVIKLRFFLMIVITIIIFTFRVESGLFAWVFFCIPIYNRYKKGNLIEKFALFVMSLFVVLTLAGSILLTMNDTLGAYTQRSLDAADVDSLGAKLQALPVPFNYIAKTLFAQLLPFPIWLPLIQSAGEGYSYLRIVECFTPLFWIPVLLALCLCFIRKHKQWNINIKLLFYISIIYLFLCSMSEFNVRRLFAVYPIIYCVYIIVKSKFNIRALKYAGSSYLMLFILHLIYMIIK